MKFSPVSANLEELHFQTANWALLSQMDPIIIFTPTFFVAAP
jgi:hypothetical protein